MYLDGKKVKSFDGYATSWQYNVTGYTKSGLQNKTHTLKLVVTSRTNAPNGSTFTDIDRFLFGAASFQGDSFRIAYGAWKGKTSPSASGSTYRESSSKTSPAEFYPSVGPEIDLVTAVGPSSLWTSGLRAPSGGWSSG